MDDIGIFNATFDDHIQSLRAVFEKLKEAGVTLKLEKCEFACDAIDFVGHNISNEGIKPQKKLTEAILNFSRPTSKRS